MEVFNVKSNIKCNLISLILVTILYEAGRTLKKSAALPEIKSIGIQAINNVMSCEYWTSVLCSVKIVIIGVFASFIIGVAISFVCSFDERIKNIIMPIINSTKNVPSIALFPLFIVLLGIGDEPRIGIIIWNSMYPIIAATTNGLMRVDKDIIDAAENCGATKLQVHLYIRVPLAITDIIHGVKVAMSNGFVAIVVAEMLGATNGIGYMILWSANTFQYPNMYAYILTIALIGLAVNFVLERIAEITERKMFYENKKSGICNYCSNYGYGNSNSLCKQQEGSRKDEHEVCRIKGV